jgi:hypothetical protein
MSVDDQSRREFVKVATAGMVTASAVTLSAVTAEAYQGQHGECTRCVASCFSSSATGDA